MPCRDYVLLSSSDHGDSLNRWVLRARARGHRVELEHDRKFPRAAACYLTARRGLPQLVSAQFSMPPSKGAIMRVQDLMSHPAITCHVNDDLNMSAKLMWDHDCGAIPVVRDDGKLAGMVTDRDICMAAYTQGRSLDQILVNSVMAKHVISAHPDQELGEVERLMAEQQVRRIPVVDEENRPVGVLSLTDLALESVEPDTRMMDGLSKVAHTLAAVSRRRVAKQVAA